MRKVLIIAVFLMSLDACSAAMARGRDNCDKGRETCAVICSKLKTYDEESQCISQCSDALNFCDKFTGGKDDNRTIKSNTGAGNTKNIPGLGTTAGAGTNAGAAPATTNSGVINGGNGGAISTTNSGVINGGNGGAISTTNSGVINGGNGGAISTTNGVTPAAQGSGSVQPIQQQRLKRQN